MARHTVVMEFTTPAASALLFNLVPAASANLKLRKIAVGWRTPGSVTDQDVSLFFYRTTAKGTSTTTVAAQALDPNSIAPQTAGCDTAWSVNPTVSANKLLERSFNTRGTTEYYFDGIDEVIVGNGTANGLLCKMDANGVAASNHVLTVELELEE